MYQNNSWKYFALLNRNLAPGQGMNVLAHGVNALARKLQDSPEIKFDRYENASGRLLGELSIWPYIVLESSSSEKLKTLRRQLDDLNISSVEFHASMLGASHEEQMAKTRLVGEGKEELYGLFTFGPAEKMHPLVKKFSLFRGFRGSHEAPSDSIHSSGAVGSR